MKKFILLNRLTARNIGLFKLSWLLILLMPLFSSGAHAGQCAVGRVKEVGTWVNPDSNTTGVTKAVFMEECRDAPQVTCYKDGGEEFCSLTHSVKLVYTAQLWGKCRPSDCYFGKVDGTYTSSKWLRFKYDHGYATRAVWAQVWSENSN